MYKKLVVTKLSPNFAEAVSIVEEPLRPPQDDEVRIRVVYVGINAPDTNVTAGRFFKDRGEDPKLPFEIGFEAIGTIDAVGESVAAQLKSRGLDVGSACGYYKGVHCAYSEYIYTKAPENLVKLPTLDVRYVPMLWSGLTASMSLDIAGRLQPRDKVLVTAAAGGTGHIAVQWAKIKGCHVIGTTSTDAKAMELAKLGCDRVINYKTEDLDEVLTREYPNGIDVIWETIGGKTTEMLFTHLAERGRMILAGGTQGYSTEGGYPQIHIPRLNTQLILGNKTLVGFQVINYPEHYESFHQTLFKYIKMRRLRPIIDLQPEKGLEAIAKGVNHLHSGKNLGKVVVQIAEI